MNKKEKKPTVSQQIKAAYDLRKRISDGVKRGHRARKLKLQLSPMLLEALDLDPNMPQDLYDAALDAQESKDAAFIGLTHLELQMHIAKLKQSKIDLRKPKPLAQILKELI